MRMDASYGELYRRAVSSMGKKSSFISRAALAMLRKCHLRLPVSTKTFFGTQMSIVLPEHVSVQIMRYGMIDREVPRFMGEVLMPGMTFMDIGAHFGFYSLLARSLIGAEGSITSFEPTPFSFGMLTKNLRCLGNAVVVNKAVSDKCGISELGVCDPVYAAFNRLGGPPEERYAPCIVEVDTVTVDAYCSQLSIIPDVMKIDVEGHELSVLKGAEAVLEAGHPSVILEYGHGDDPEEPVLMMLEMGYSAFALVDGDVRKVAIEDLKSLVQGESVLLQYSA